MNYPTLMQIEAFCKKYGTSPLQARKCLELSDGDFELGAKVGEHLYLAVAKSYPVGHVIRNHWMQALKENDGRGPSGKWVDIGYDYKDANGVTQRYHRYYCSVCAHTRQYTPKYCCACGTYLPEIRKPKEEV